jgi:hypothetical protein
MIASSLGEEFKLFNISYNIVRLWFPLIFVEVIIMTQCSTIASSFGEKFNLFNISSIH